MGEFDDLLQAHLLPLQRYVRYKIANRHDAEDILQEVCLTASQSFDSLKDQSAFKAWLIGIAEHKCMDYYRKKARMMEIPLDALSESSLRVGRCGITEQSVVRDTLDALGDREKQILYLYYFRDLPQEEIARRLDIPVGTVKSRLHYAREKFREQYPYKPRTEGEMKMTKLPEYLPRYEIEAADAPVFPVVFEELPNWFIVPRTGASINWASYDMPGRHVTERVHSKVTGEIEIHGVEGVEITSQFENICNDWADDAPEHIYYAQLTETHCRWLGEYYVGKDGKKHLLTFLDGDDFTTEWGYGENNCGRETHLIPRGNIRREGGTIVLASAEHVIDVVGRYTVRIGGNSYDTLCVMEYFENGAFSEAYIDQTGRTILWRRFNKNDWASSRYGKLWTEMLPDNERLTVNGETYVHWYDCVTDYIF